MSRYQKKRFVAPKTASPVRVVDGREICLGNAAGRAEYRRRKQLLWEEQQGQCALHSCACRMTLDDTRMTGGEWSESDPPQLRDDRLVDRRTGRAINYLVHKGCLRRWHEERAILAMANPPEETNPDA
jgi:hypothetical protein